MKKITKGIAAVVAGLTLSLGITAGATAAPVAPKAISHPCQAVTTYGAGPSGRTQYRAWDRYCGPNYNAGGEWFGPWRNKRATADHDRDVRNAGRA